MIQKEKEEVEILDAFQLGPSETRTKLMPLWFRIVSVMLILSGMYSIYKLIDNCMSFLQMDPLLKIMSGGFFYRIAASDAISMLTMCAAVLFLLLRKSAPVFGMILGILRILVVVNTGPVMITDNFFSIFITLTWTLAILIWVIHVFRINKRWRAALPGKWK